MDVNKLFQKNLSNLENTYVENRGITAAILTLGEMILKSSDSMPEILNKQLRLNNIIDELSARIDSGSLDLYPIKQNGIRSRQIISLIELLIERGIL